MSLHTLRQPCWAWALQDGRKLNSSSNAVLPRLGHRTHNVQHLTSPRSHSCDASASLEPHQQSSFGTSVLQQQATQRQQADPLQQSSLQQLQQQQANFSIQTVAPLPAGGTWQPQQHQPIPSQHDLPPSLYPDRQLQQQPLSHQQHQQQQQQYPYVQQQLPDPVLFQQIKACTSWADCLALLHSRGPQLDAMLLSTLCTHTVHLFEVQQYHNMISATATHPAQMPTQDGNHSSNVSSSKPAAGNRDSSSSSGSTSRHGDTAVQQQYMSCLSGLALQLALSGSCRPQQYSNVLWCFARCSYSLPPAWMHAYLSQVQQQLQHFPPRNLGQLIWAVAALQAHLPPSFLHTLLAASGARLPGFKPIDLANTLWGLAKLGAKPPPTWLSAALAASAQCWAGFKPFELSISVWGFARLGVQFREPERLAPLQQQRQERRSTAAPPLPAAAAAAGEAGVGKGGRGSSSSSCMVQGAGLVGYGWLLSSMALLVPSMGQQEIANLLWGLAVGKAALPQQHVQALGGQLCIILAQSLSPSRLFIASLTVSLWALSTLRWTPTLRQASILVRLLTQAAASGGLDMKHACVLLYSLGRLRLRLPAPVLQYLMSNMAAGMAGASMADLLQVLGGCRRLGWRISKPWWRTFYRDSLPALQQGSAAELVGLAAALASHSPLKPTKGWWEVFWDSMGVELEATLQARGLSHIAYTTNLPKGCVGKVTAALKVHLLQPGAGKSGSGQQGVGGIRRKRRRVLVGSRALQTGSSDVPQGDRSSVDSCSCSSSGGGDGNSSAWRSCVSSPEACCAGSSSSSGSSSIGSNSKTSGGSSSSSSQWVPHPLAWVAMQEALQIVTNLQDVSCQQPSQPLAQPPQPPPQPSQPPAQPPSAGVVTARHAAVLLWACARLQRVPPWALLWQLLLLVLTDVHALSPKHLTLVLWSLGRMVHLRGRHQVKCYKVIEPLALAVQWRLRVGLAGGREERRRLVHALRYLAAQHGSLMSLLLLHEDGEETGLVVASSLP